jgi:hypothetical protein
MKINAWHRRHALCAASSLPDDREDALAVLEYVQELVATFLHSDPAEPAKATVVALVRDRRELTA